MGAVRGGRIATVLARGYLFSIFSIAGGNLLSPVSGAFSPQNIEMILYSVNSAIPPMRMTSDVLPKTIFSASVIVPSTSTFAGLV